MTKPVSTISVLTLVLGCADHMPPAMSQAMFHSANVTLDTQAMLLYLVGESQLHHQEFRNVWIPANLLLVEVMLYAKEEEMLLLASVSRITLVIPMLPAGRNAQLMQNVPQTKLAKDYTVLTPVQGQDVVSMPNVKLSITSPTVSVCRDTLEIHSPLVADQHHQSLQWNMLIHVTQIPVDRTATLQELLEKDVNVLVYQK